MFKDGIDIGSLTDQLLRKYPIFGSVLSDVKIKYSKKVLTAGTDGKTIYLNKDYMRSLSEKEQLFIFGHEACHIALNHLERANDRDTLAWNYATDAIINEHLVKDGFVAPQGAIRRKDALNYDAEDLYDEIYKAHQKAQEQKMQNSNNNQPNCNQQQGGSSNKLQDQQQNTSQNKQQQNQQNGQQNGQQKDEQKQTSQQNTSQGKQIKQSQSGAGQNGQLGGKNQQQTSQMQNGSGQLGNGGANWNDKNGEKTNTQNPHSQNSQQNASQNKQQNGGTGKQSNGQENGQQNTSQNKQQQNQQNEQKQDVQNQKEQQPSTQNSGSLQKNGSETDQNNQNSEENGQNVKTNKGNQQKSDSSENKNSDNGNSSQNSTQNKQNDLYNGVFDAKDENKVGHDDHSMWQQVKEKKKEQNNADSDKTDDENNDEYMTEKDFFKKNEELKSEEAQEIMERLRSQSRGFEGGSQFALSDIGDADKRVTDWRKLLNSYVEQEEERWGHRFSDKGNNWAARIEDFEPDERAETEIILDTSGSVSPELLRAFLRQTKTILKDSDIKVGMFSGDFYGWQKVKKAEDIDNLQFMGGGGTNFDAASRAFSKKKTVNKVCLTDGEDGGDAGIREKRNDIIWICYGNHNFKPDNGKVLYVSPIDLAEKVKKNDGRTY